MDCTVIRLLGNIVSLHLKIFPSESKAETNLILTSHFLIIFFIYFLCSTFPHILTFNKHIFHLANLKPFNLLQWNIRTVPFQLFIVTVFSFKVKDHQFVELR